MPAVSIRFPILVLLAATGCGPGGDDTGLTVTAMCEGQGNPSLTIGTGTAASFAALSDGDTVAPSGAPQGGVGVPIRASTTGLVTDTAPVSVQLDTYVDGVLSASFTNDSVQLFCQDDGTGLFSDQVVGLDADLYPDIQSLTGLGLPVELVVTATDVNGTTAEGRVIVDIEVGG